MYIHNVFILYLGPLSNHEFLRNHSNIDTLTNMKDPTVYGDPQALTCDQPHGFLVSIPFQMQIDLFIPCVGL